MIKLCIFDMGGVLIRNHNVAPLLLKFLGREETSFTQLDPAILQGLREHSRGLLSEDEFWQIYTRITGDILPAYKDSLLGKFFIPTIDPPTLKVLTKLKQAGIRIVCGTNVIDSHYKIHLQNSDYAIFDAVYASHIMHVSKPAPDFYTLILDAEQVLPSETFFTDDLEGNIESSRAVGITSFVYTDADSLMEQLQSCGVL